LSNSSGAEVQTSAPVVLLCNCPVAQFWRVAADSTEKEETAARFLLDFAYITCRNISQADLRMPCRVLLRHENP